MDGASTCGQRPVLGLLPRSTGRTAETATVNSRSTGQTSSGPLISHQSVTAPGSSSGASVLVKDYRIDYDTIRRLLRMRRPLWYWVLLNAVVLVASWQSSISRSTSQLTVCALLRG